MISNVSKALPFLAMAYLLSSCASIVGTSRNEDDVYYLPSQAPPVQASAAEPEAPVAEQNASTPSEDYYDADAAQQYAGPGSYYDATYNDPYYYNYGRFGFGTGLGYQNGWGMGPQGFAIQWGYGTGVYSGWFGPSFGLGFGYPYGYSWGYPYGGYNNPWGWYNDPYYGGGYGYGNGYGNYWGPWGNCNCGYTPIVIGGSGNTVVGHRPSMNSNGRADNGVYQSRSLYRDPVGLSTGSNSRVLERGSPIRNGTVERHSSGARPVAPSRTHRPITPPVTERRPEHRAPVQRDPAPGNGRSGGDRSGGERSAPSRSDGGGSRSPGHRSR